MASRPIAEGLFSAEPAPRLVGGRHRQTGRIVFPFPDGSEAALYDRVMLSNRGVVWSYTIQRFRPKSPPYAGPEAFEPFALAYVELPGEIIVETRLTGCAFADIRAGMPVEMTLIPFTRDADGTEVTTYAFRPLKEGASR